MNRTDTVRLPRVVATAAHPLVTPRRAPRWRAGVLVVLLFVVGIFAAFGAGRAVAWTSTPVVTITHVDPATLNGTDAGLITEPAR